MDGVEMTSSPSRFLSRSRFRLWRTRAFSRLSASFWGSMSVVLGAVFARFLGDFDGDGTDRFGSNGWIVFWSLSMTVTATRHGLWTMCDGGG